MYGGYFFVLFLIYAVAGFCRLTITGWVTSFRMCCQEGLPVLSNLADINTNSACKESEDRSIDDKPTKEKHAELYTYGGTVDVSSSFQ